MTLSGSHAVVRALARASPQCQGTAVPAEGVCRSQDRVRRTSPKSPEKGSDGLSVLWGPPLSSVLGRELMQIGGPARARLALTSHSLSFLLG